MKSLLQVLKDNKLKKQSVTIDPTDSAESFWKDFTRDCYYNKELESMYVDGDVRNSLSEFAEKDSLEVVNKQGRILKRFAKFWKETRGEKLPDKIAGIIGDRFQYFHSKKKEEDSSYIIDFTNSINWDDGMFGKEDSCWWGCYSSSIPTFENGGGWAIRFYLDMDDEQGIGRTWIMPQEGVLLCFNAYGIERPQVSKVIKQVFKDEGIVLHYKQCSIENSQNSDIPYINSGTGFVLYPEGIEPQESYDLDLEVYGDDRKKCYNCSRYFDDDDLCTVNDESYCNRCVERLFRYCDRCEEYCDKDDVHPVNHRTYSYLCEWCMSKEGFEECESCNNWTQDCIQTDEDTTYCEGCNRFDYCDDCECFHEDSDFHAYEEGLASKYEAVQIYDGEFKGVVWRTESDGIFLIKNSGWRVLHESSKLTIFSSNIRGKAMKVLKELSNLTDWTRDKESITNDLLLMDKIRQISIQARMS